MSRIFDALQRTGFEQTGVEYPDLVSVVTSALETPQEQASKTNLRLERELEIQPDRNSFGAGCQELEDGLLPLQGSLDVEVPSGSRLTYFTDPHSLAAEKFRFLGVRLRQLRQNRPLKRVLVTSSLAEEGKSLVSANLAGVLARRKERVLLIEGDLRRPGLTDRFGLRDLSGLADSLQNGQEAKPNVYFLRGPDLWFMPAGEPPANALELMQSGRLSEIMTQLTPMFDWVIIDSPPLLPLADTTVWQRFADGTLLVVREGKTEKKALQRTIEVLKKGDLLGVVLNGSSNSNQRNYYQRYSRSGAK